MTTPASPAPNTDMVALQAQCDISRLFDVVFLPAVQAVEGASFVVAPPPPEILADWPEPGAMLGLAGFDQPSPPSGMLREVRQAMLDEAQRGLAVILGAAFERHVKTWLIGKVPAARDEIGKASWRDLVDRIHDQLHVDLRAIEGLTRDIRELWELVSASRHGDGGAATNLAAIAPHLWPTADLLASSRSGDVRVTEADVRRYYGAVLVFWGAVGATPCPERRGPRRLSEPAGEPEEQALG